MNGSRPWNALERSLRAHAAAPTDSLLGAARLTRDARAQRPEIVDALERRLKALELAHEIEAAAGAVDPVELLDDLLLPFVRARIPLRPRAEATAWAHDTVLGLLDRFIGVGPSKPDHGTDPTRPDTTEEPAPMAVRLALAAAWLAWSDALVDPGAARAHRATLHRTLDAIDAGLRSGRWELRPTECDLALAALTVEEHLARHDRRAHAAVE